MEWLNANTLDRSRFFGVEIELWRIGESAPAPRFSVIVQPNDWVRREKAALRAAEPTEAGNKARTYWEAFEAYLAQHAPSLGRERPSATPTCWLEVPGTDFVVSVNRVRKSGPLLFPRSAATARDAERKAAADERLRDLADRLAQAMGPQARIGRDGIPVMQQPGDIDNPAEWPAQFVWVLDNYHRIAEVLQSAPQL